MGDDWTTGTHLGDEGEESHVGGVGGGGGGFTRGRCVTLKFPF